MKCFSHNHVDGNVLYDFGSNLKEVKHNSKTKTIRMVQ